MSRLVALLAWFLSGCSPLPVVHIYSLPPPRPAAGSSAAAALFPGVMMVMRPAADGVLADRRLVWRSSPDGLTVGHYSDHLWSRPPPEEMQAQIETCLARHGAATFIVPDTSAVPPDWMLEGRLLYFEQQLTGPAASAQARIAGNLTIAMAKGCRRPVWHQAIDVAVPLPDAAPEHLASGMQRSLHLFCSALVRSIEAKRLDGIGCGEGGTER